MATSKKKARSAGAMSINPDAVYFRRPAGWQCHKLESYPPTIDSQLQLAIVRVSTVGQVVGRRKEGRKVPTAARRRVDVAWGEAGSTQQAGSARACAGRSFGRVRNRERSASAFNGHHRHTLIVSTNQYQSALQSHPIELDSVTKSHHIRVQQLNVAKKNKRLLPL